MRKPRNYNAELEALADRAKQLKARHVTQLGELVMACKADGLSPETLAGALLAAVDADAATREAYRKRGAAFFSGERAEAGGGSRGTGGKPASAAPDSGSAIQGSLV